MKIIIILFITIIACKSQYNEILVTIYGAETAKVQLISNNTIIQEKDYDRAYIKEIHFNIKTDNYYQIKAINQKDTIVQNFNSSKNKNIIIEF